MWKISQLESLLTPYDTLRVEEFLSWSYLKIKDFESISQHIFIENEVCATNVFLVI